LAGIRPEMAYLAGIGPEMAYFKNLSRNTVKDRYIPIYIQFIAKEGVVDEFSLDLCS
jgi:hypothetical protein